MQRSLFKIKRTRRRTVTVLVSFAILVAKLNKNFKSHILARFFVSFFFSFRYPTKNRRHTTQQPKVRNTMADLPRDFPFPTPVSGQSQDIYEAESYNDDSGYNSTRVPSLASSDFSFPTSIQPTAKSLREKFMCPHPSSAKARRRHGQVWWRHAMYLLCCTFSLERMKRPFDRF